MKFNIYTKIIIIVLFIPVLFISQYYLFKFGVISPQIKGLKVKVVDGQYIKDIDKYVIKLNKEVIFSTGDYVKFPVYAKNINLDFKSLDEDNIVKIENNSENIKNTFKITGVKKGLTSVAVVKKNKIVKKFNILVVDPKVIDLNTEIEGSLKYVGDKAVIKNYVEVDFDRFDEKYNVEYESSDEDVFKIENNKIQAIGVGNATITASLGDKKESFNYDIVAKIKNINVQKNINIKIGEKRFVNASVETIPKNLTTPKIKYKFVENKLPIQRKIRLDENGQIIGLREGLEKILVSCGSGENKSEKVILINVSEN